MKLPKDIAIMVEKGNLVSAIKNLANEEGISMDEAKTHIDNHEIMIKKKQKKQQEEIINKQAKIQNQTHTTSADSNATLGTNHEMSDGINNGFDSLNTGLKQHLEEQGYKKTLFPYWYKRIALIALVIVTVCLIGWLLIN